MACKIWSVVVSCWTILFLVMKCMTHTSSSHHRATITTRRLQSGIPLVELPREVDPERASITALYTTIESTHGGRL